MKKNFFFEKLGLLAKPDCRGNRLNSETFYFGFFPKIEFSRSLYKKKRNFDYGHLTCFEAYFVLF